MEVQMTRPEISESGSLLPREVRAESAAIEGATGSLFKLNGALCSDSSVAGDQAGEVGSRDAELIGEALLLSAGELSCVGSEIHAELPSGTFTSKCTIGNGEVKVLSHLVNGVSNNGMDIAEIRRIRLRQLITEQFGGTDAAFALTIEKQPSYVSRLFSENENHRRNLGDKLAREIEKKCVLETGWLDRPLEDAERPQQSKPLYELEPVRVWDDKTPLDEDEMEVPFLKEVELSAGSGRTVITESGYRKMRFGIRTMRNRGVEPANAVCVTVNGNSMEPVLRSGATVGVDRGNTRISDGDMYAIDHDGQLRVKQLYRMPGGGIRLRSFNRDEHPDEEYTPEQIEKQKIRVIGRVWWGAMFF